MAFSGFPRDTLYTPTPDPLFGPLLEEIHDIAELKVTLRGLWLMFNQRKVLRAVALEEFLSDATLLRTLRVGPESANSKPINAPAEIRRGLRQAVQRGVFLFQKIESDSNDAGRTFFVLNNDAGRRILSRMKESGAEPGTADFGTDEAPLRPQERPNIFALYEDNIGLLGPMVKEWLEEAEKRYPASWIREAFEIAVRENKRNWYYISAILNRWGAEGKGGWTGASNDDGKLGRSTAENQRQKHIEVYQRRRGNTNPRTNSR